MESIKRKVLFIVCLFALLLAFSSVAFAAEGGGGIFSGLESLANFFKRIFVPDKDYFMNKIAGLNDRLNDRFGGIAYLYQLLHHFFSAIGSSSTAAITFKLPNNYFFEGYRGMTVDFFQLAKPYINVLRSVLTSAYVLFISICCYHRLRTLFRE